jgi:hypothetical protein
MRGSLQKIIMKKKLSIKGNDIDSEGTFLSA